MLRLHVAVASLFLESLAYSKEEFTDWECERTESKFFMWPSLRELAVTEASQMLRPLRSSPLLSSTSAEFGQMSSLWQAIFNECPLGTIFLAAMELGNCLADHSRRIEPCEDVGSFMMDTMFGRGIPIAVLLTASWPLNHALHMPFLYAHTPEDKTSKWYSIQNDPALNCEGDGIWPKIQKQLDSGIGDGLPLLEHLRSLIFSPEVQNLEAHQLSFPGDFVPGCAFGWLAVLLVKAGISWHTETFSYFSYEFLLKPYLAELKFWEFLGSGWFLSMLFCRICMYHRTNNEMGFLGRELLQDAGSLGSLTTLRLEGSPIFRATAAAVLGEGVRAYVVKGETRLLTYAVYVWGKDFTKWLPAYIARFHSLGVHNLMVFGDEGAYEACSTVSGSVCLHLPTKNSLHRYTIPLALMNLGVDAFVIDFDIYPFRDPTPILISELESYDDAPELLLSGSYGDACICNALALYRSTTQLREFTRGLLDWLYENPFPHGVTQKALSAFLGEKPVQKVHSKEPWVVKAEMLALTLPPRPSIAWSLLDPGVQFPTSAKLETSGWAGDPDDIVIYHFFHGSWLEAESALAVNDTGRDELDLFYNTTCDGEPQTCEERRQQRILEHLMANRKGDVRPFTDRSCYTLPVNEIDAHYLDSENLGKGFLDKRHIEKRDALSKEIQDKIKERNEIRDEFRQKEREYNAYQAELKKARQEKILAEKAERQKEIDRRRKERKAEELDTQPYISEITLIEQTILFCKNLVQTKTEDKKDEKKEVVHNTKEGEEVLLRKEEREEEFYFAPTKGKKSKSKSKSSDSAPAAKPIRHNAGTFSLFKQLDLDAPMSTEEVPALIEKLEGMLEDYKVKVKEWEETREEQKRRILEGLEEVEEKKPAPAEEAPEETKEEAKEEATEE